MFALMRKMYPDLDVDVLIALQMVGQLSEESLDDPACPYDDATRETLRSVVGHAQSGSSQPSSWNGLNGIDEMINSLETVYKGLGGLTASGKDKAAIYRSQLTAIEKAVSIKGQLLNLKKLTDFQVSVMNLLETVMTPEQREEFLEKLKAEVKNG